MRAVSSPSMCENQLETVKCPKKPRHDENVPTVEPNQTTNNTTSSVLQKFRKTFSNLKGRSSASSGTMPQTNQVTSNSCTTVNNVPVASVPAATCNEGTDIAKYRFGPLIWRTSKERRKTKHHRRDKCNSGDSGIQVELENDEGTISNDVTDSCLDTSPSFNVRVRRANSAKVSSNTLASAVKTRVLKRNEGVDKLYLTPIPSRSLSQPYGLNQITSCKSFSFVVFFHFLCSELLSELHEA